jgi:hypothetical protein
MHHENSHFLVIARFNERIYIARCGHGIIHLVWGMVTLRFRPQDFVQVARLMEQGAIGDRNQHVSNGAVCLTQDENGNFSLKVKEFVLHLTTIDFLLLVDLMHSALMRLGYVHANQPSLPSPPPPAVPKHEFMRNSFSLN